MPNVYGVPRPIFFQSYSFHRAYNILVAVQHDCAYLAILQYLQCGGPCSKEKVRIAASMS